jgi:hypothetical protein
MGLQEQLPSFLQQARDKAKLLVDVPRELALMTPGAVRYLASGTTSFRAYGGMRRLYYLTDGRFHNTVHEVLRRLRPPVALDRTIGVLGDMQGAHLERVLRALDQDGYYVFDQRLPHDSLQEIREFALRTPCIPHGEGVSPEPVRFDENKQLAPKLLVPSNDLLRCPPLRNLMLDRSILALGQAYLNSSVVMDAPTMWWSVASSGQPSSAAAQLFHVDLDRLRWLNFFFLITDVDTNNGPHCYVRNSHHHKPTALLRDGRYSDEEIANHYPNDVVEIGGVRGTIFVADTRGFHKGKVLYQGNRLMFQIVLADSLFGQTYESVTVPRDLEPEFQDVRRRFPFTYSNFRSASLA